MQSLEERKKRILKWEMAGNSCAVKMPKDRKLHVMGKAKQFRTAPEGGRSASGLLTAGLELGGTVWSSGAFL